MPFARDPAAHAEIDRPVAASLPGGAVATPMAPQECIDVPGADAVDSLGHLALKRKPPHFAVGHDVEPRQGFARWPAVDLGGPSMAGWQNPVKAGLRPPRI